MAESPPLIRAMLLQSNLDALTLLGAEVAADVRRALDPEVLAEVSYMPGNRWVSIDVDTQLTHAIAARCGVEAVRNWAREGLERAADTPMLRPLVGALRVFGLTPGGVVKIFPRGYDGLYRNCGVMRRTVLDDQTVELCVDGAPPEMTGSATYVEGMAGAFDASFGLSGVRGRTQVAVDDGRTLRFTLHWT